MKKVFLNGIEKVIETGEEIVLTIVGEAGKTAELTANDLIRLSKNAKFGALAKGGLILVAFWAIVMTAAFISEKVYNTEQKKTKMSLNESDSR